MASLVVGEAGQTGYCLLSVQESAVHEDGNRADLEGHQCRDEDIEEEAAHEDRGPSMWPG